MWELKKKERNRGTQKKRRKEQNGIPEGEGIRSYREMRGEPWQGKRRQAFGSANKGIAVNQVCTEVSIAWSIHTQSEDQTKECQENIWNPANLAKSQRGYYSAGLQQLFIDNLYYYNVLIYVSESSYVVKSSGMCNIKQSLVTTEWQTHWVWHGHIQFKNQRKCVYYKKHLRFCMKQM